MSQNCSIDINALGAGPEMGSLLWGSRDRKVQVQSNTTALPPTFLGSNSNKFIKVLIIPADHPP